MCGEHIRQTLNAFDVYVNIFHIDGLVQGGRNSISNALEFFLSCTDPSICTLYAILPTYKYHNIVNYDC